MRKSGRTSPGRSGFSISGVFLTRERWSEWEPYWRALKGSEVENQIGLHHIVATSYMISAFIPEVLQNEAEAWLVFYRPDRKGELLVLPYPDLVVHEQWSKVGSIERHAFETLEEIRGNRDRPWYANIGYSNLSMLKTGRTQRLYIPELRINRFQLVNTELSFEQIIERTYEPRQRIAIMRSATHKTALVRKQRQEVLDEILKLENPTERQELLEGFESSLLKHNLELAEEVAGYRDINEYSQLLHAFDDLLDSETKKFLASSAIVKRFAIDRHFVDFDFSLPASGLWKTVERELNASLVWFLRAEKGVTDRKSPWIAKLPKAKKVPLEGRNLNKQDDELNGQLESVMLGWICKYLEMGYKNGFYDELKKLGVNLETLGIHLPFVLGPSDKLTPDEGSLPWLLGEVTNIRNRHAHIQPMTKEVMLRLEELLLAPLNEPWSSNLGRILSVKRSIMQYMESTSHAGY